MSEIGFTTEEFIVFWVSLMSLTAVVLTVYDKIAAKRFPKKRIPENTLIYIGVLGGAAAEFITMLSIRHKTKHKKFTVGLPVIITVQLALLAVYYFALR